MNNFLHQKVDNAVIELQIALFCFLLMLLSFVYSIVDPDIGNLVCRVSIVTFCFSLTIFLYKCIFHNLGGILMWVFFLSLYVAGIVKALNLDNGVITRVAFFIAFLSIAIKLFKAIFFIGSNHISDSEEDFNMGEDVVKCPKCGEVNPKENIYCESCGFKLKE